jgi:hypothetical protein
VSEELGAELRWQRGTGVVVHRSDEHNPEMEKKNTVESPVMYETHDICNPHLISVDQYLTVHYHLNTRQ